MSTVHIVHITKEFDVHLHTLLATLGTVGSLMAAQPLLAEENGAGCNLRETPELTRMELARAGVAHKLELFKQNLQKLHGEFRPQDETFTVVVVHCDSLREPAWDKRFGKIDSVSPPIPASFIIYTTPKLLRKYDPYAH